MSFSVGALFNPAIVGCWQFGSFHVKWAFWPNEMQGTFLVVLFVSCGFMEGAHLLCKVLGGPNLEVGAWEGHSLHHAAFLSASLTSAHQVRIDLNTYC